MERAEKQGLAVAAVGHVLLFAALSIGLMSARIPKPPLADTMDVTIADAVGMQAASPQASEQAPAPSEAPKQGRPEESAPPPPEPAPPEPQPTPTPTPTPPKPRPRPPEPTPPKPVPPKPVPKPTPPKPEPKPVPKPASKPTPAKSTPRAEAKPAPTKSTSATDATPSKATAKPAPAKKTPGLPSDLLKGLPADRGSGRTTGQGKPKGSRLGSDFLKGLSPDKSAGTSQAPRGAVSARSMAGLVGLIAAKVKPCYNPPAGGADAGQIVTTLSIRMNRDGSVANVTAGSQSGVNASNGAYARQMADAARRAVLRCSPISGLPQDLYQGGWDDFDFRFRPEQMQ